MSSIIEYLSAHPYQRVQNELVQIARVPALETIHWVQDTMYQRARAHQLNDALCRMIKGDLAEAFLVKDTKALADDTEFQQLTRMQDRIIAYRFKLEIALCVWLIERNLGDDAIALASLYMRDLSEIYKPRGDDASSIF